MEHRLIEGGEQYLPLARSEIKRLRATGLPYATKRLVFPDATVRVQIIDDIDFIHIKGGGNTPLHMDSGVVQVLSILPAVPARYTAGTLYETTYVAAYNATFVLPVSGLPPRLRTPNAKPIPSRGQFSGIVQRTGLKVFFGQVPNDDQNALSFSPNRILDASVPPVYISNPADDGLHRKKQISVLCPASMFTGRCRLYIQALYGAHLYTGKDGKQTSHMPYDIIDISTGARPALMINNKVSSLDAIFVGSSAGVYLDPKTGKHWLFRFTGWTAGYPLKASAFGESLRKYLVTEDRDPNIEVLNTEDMEHLETYILSQSLPSGIGTDAAGTPYLQGQVREAYSLGYSWHWNWDGLLADAVEHDTYLQLGLFYGMVSTHRRLTVERVSDAKFQVSESVVEGPTQWSVNRGEWAITGPDWGTYLQRRLTPKFSNPAASDAPIYAFYARDDLKVLRVQIDSIPLVGRYRLMSPYYHDSSSYGDNPSQHRTFKTDGGFYEDHVPDTAYLSGTFTCGDVTLPDLHTLHSSTADGATLSTRTMLSWVAGFGSPGFSPSGWYVPSGDAIAGPSEVGAAYSVTPTPGSNYTQVLVTSISDATPSQHWSVVYKRHTYYDRYESRATICVPFYDAESIYMEAEKYESRTDYVYKDDTWSSSAGVTLGNWARRNDTSSGNIEFYGWDVNGPANIAVMSVVDNGGWPYYASPTNTIPFSLSKFVWKGPSVDAVFTNLSQFHNAAEDIVEGVAMYTLTGTRSDTPVAYAPGNIIPAVGMNSRTPDVAVLVGWV